MSSPCLTCSILFMVLFLAGGVRMCLFHFGVFLVPTTVYVYFEKMQQPCVNPEPLKYHTLFIIKSLFVGWHIIVNLETELVNEFCQNMVWLWFTNSYTTELTRVEDRSDLKVLIVTLGLSIGTSCVFVANQDLNFFLLKC